ncbi:MAG: YfhO family protein [Acutalibacteraceae bacterium]
MMTKHKYNLRLVGYNKNYPLLTFLWGLGLAFLLFLPFIIYNEGYFFFYGDFNVQQIPFYQMIHDAIQNGNLGWNTTTDLGANIVGSYSFYMFGSPFFWITMLFPSDAVPYLMAPMLMIKFALASMGGYIFLRRYVRNQNYAVFGGLLYAFSGFGIYNIFFNHFHEAMVIFPFMLAAMDELIYNKRKGVMALAVFASCVMNYYFFAGQAVFVFIYWCVRMVTGSYRMSLKDFLRLAFEVIIGFAAAAFIFFPTALAVMQNSRVSNAPSGWNGLTYSSEQRYWHILISMFFPPDMPAYANFTPDSNAKWASVAAWLPLFSMVGVFAFAKLKKHKWLRYFIPMLIVFAFVPVLNSMFQLLNITYYARWFYMLTLMFALATVITIDSEEADFRGSLQLTAIITVGITILIGFSPTKNSDGETTYGLMKYPDRFWIWVAIAAISLILLTIALQFFYNKKKVFIRLVSVFLSIVIVGYSWVLVGAGVFNANYKKDFIINAALHSDEETAMSDIQDVRSDFYSTMDNMGMFWQIPTIQAFQSIVPGSVMDFYKSVGVERSVASRPETDYYGLRSLLSVKYLFDYKNDSKSFRNSAGETEMPAWNLYKETDEYYIYENANYIPYGFTYEDYITEEQYNASVEYNRHLLLLKAIVLTDEQAKKYGDILTHRKRTSEYAFTKAQYDKDCENRKYNTCTPLQWEHSGFTSTFTTTFTAQDSDELVFFSIPYESGWSATVNGKPVEIEKVNVGFMAVRVPANKKSTICFTYTTPGLFTGVIISLISFVLFAVYMIFVRVKPRKKQYAFDDVNGNATLYFDEPKETPVTETDTVFPTDEMVDYPDTEDDFEDDIENDSIKDGFDSDDGENRRTRL